MSSDCSSSLPPTTQTLTSMSFEAALAELEALVQGMEQPGLPLDALLQGYQRGMALSQFCHKQLSHAQGELERLSANALPATEPASGVQPEGSV